MFELLLIDYVILFVITVTKSLAIGWLLLTSSALGGYCLIVMFSKEEKLTDIGKWILVFLAIGFIYSVMIISGFDIKRLF